jgi:DNA polymerase-3 subunit alpha
MMGFMTIEDLQGSIELVIFPKTWDKTRGLCEQGKVIVVDGKVDSSSQPPKILVDVIKTEVTFYDSAPAPLDKGKQTGPASHAPQPPPAKQSAATSRPVTAQPAPLVMRPHADDFIPDPDDGLDGAPPPPEFPPDWENYTAPNRQYGFSAPATPDAAFFPAQPAEKIEEEPQAGATASAGDSQKVEAVSEIPAVVESLPEPVAAASSEPVVEMSDPPSARTDLIPDVGLTLRAVIESLELERPTLPPILPPQIFSVREEDNTPPQLISILMRPSGNPERDRRRIKHIYGILISYPGSDRFSFRIFENGKGYLLDFPNDTTRVCQDLLERLKRLIGEDSWRVEPLVYQ